MKHPLPRWRCTSVNGIDIVVLLEKGIDSQREKMLDRSGFIAKRQGRLGEQLTAFYDPHAAAVFRDEQTTIGSHSDIGWQRHGVRYFLQPEAYAIACRQLCRPIVRRWILVAGVQVRGRCRD